VSAYGCAQVRDLAPELALGLLNGGERAAVLAHLEVCPSCQALICELAEAADRLPLLATEAEPPAGFERRVLHALTGTRRRRSLRRPLAVAAAGVAAAIIASAVVVRGVDSGDVRPGVVQAANSPRTVSMIGANAVLAGKLFVFGRDHASVALTIDYAVPDGTYQLEVRHDADPGSHLGAIRVRDGRGSWTGTVSLPASSASSIVLVDRDNRTVCHADLAPPT
jgi:predicted anti-sigma-YlaC factor YlaD